MNRRILLLSFLAIVLVGGLLLLAEPVEKMIAADQCEQVFQGISTPGRPFSQEQETEIADRLTEVEASEEAINAYLAAVREFVSGGGSREAVLAAANVLNEQIANNGGKLETSISITRWVTVTIFHGCPVEVPQDHKLYLPIILYTE